MQSWYLRPLLGVALLALQATGSAAAGVCAVTGAAAPDVTTLMVSATLPREQGWIVGPDCDFETVDLVRIRFEVVDRAIEHLTGVPSEATYVTVKKNPLSRGADFTSGAKLNYLWLATFSAKMVENLVLPASLYQLILADSPFTSLASVKFPDSLQELNIQQSQLKSLKSVSFPGLRTLSVESSKLTTLDFEFPPLLKELTITKSPIKRLQRLTLPDSLLKLEFANSTIATVKGVTWPASLQYLGLAGNPITSFEIRESDLAIFEQLKSFIGDFAQPKCSDPTATLTQIKQKSVCVISGEWLANARFESLYRSTSTSSSPPPSAGSTTKPSSTTPTDTPKDEVEGKPSPTPEAEAEAEAEETDAEAEAESETENPADTSPQTSTDRKTSSSPSPSGTPRSINQTTGSSTGSLSLGAVASPLEAGSRSPSRTTVVVETRTPSNGSSLKTVFVVLSIVLAAVLGGIIYLVFVASKRRQRGDSTTKYSRMASPSVSTTGSGNDTHSSNCMAPSQEYLSNDVRNDKALAALRIEQKHIQLSTPIARGGFGVIYQATYQGQDVAVKQMLPDTWQNDRLLASFMDEIRLCASLDHPKIVAFVGIAYSSLRDLSVVIELMAGGDLHALLYKQQGLKSSASDWIAPWTSNQIHCKASIGHDVAEAVAYLHSRAIPILHRDLKAKNVLLDLQGNAKLSDFGISRELLMDETMTSEVGTAAWIAPEVLRGARYSEKADIYSLGVLLVELDRCSHPYANEPALQLVDSQASGRADGPAHQPSTMSSIAHKNTQIAVLVSTGRLRPSVSSECPERVASLVAKCLSFDPADRPSAQEVSEVLRVVGHVRKD